MDDRKQAKRTHGEGDQTNVSQLLEERWDKLAKKLTTSIGVYIKNASEQFAERNPTRRPDSWMELSKRLKLRWKYVFNVKLFQTCIDTSVCAHDCNVIPPKKAGSRKLRYRLRL